MRKMLLGVIWILIIASAQTAFAQLVPGIDSKDNYVPPPRDSVLFSTIGGIDPGGAWTVSSQNFTDPAFNGFFSAGADDFTVTGNGWEITQIEVVGTYSAGGGPAASVNIYILGNSGSLPDTTNLSAGAIYAAENLSYTDTNDGDFLVTLPGGGVSLNAGTYWLVVQANMAFGAAGQWFWTESADGFDTGMTFGFESGWMQETQAFLGATCVDAWGARLATCGQTRPGDPTPLEGDFALAVIGNAYVPGITVDPTSVTTSEAGVSNTFDVVLDAPPLAGETVTIDIDGTGDATEGSTAPASLVFSKANWNIPQTVTVTPVDDAVADGDVMWTVLTDPAVSGDPSYSGLDAADVTVTNQDDDVAGITVSPVSGLSVSEDGTVTASFDINANTPPTDDVMVDLTASAGVSLDVDPVTLPSGSTAPVTVTVTGMDNDIDDGDLPFTITTEDPTSAGDAIYDALGAADVADVSGTRVDDDTAGVTVTPVGGEPLNTSEPGPAPTETIDYVLDSEPTADVVLDLSVSDTSEASIDTAMLTFTSANWDTPQTVTVSGLDDDIDDGDVPYSVISSSATSTDPNYSGLPVASVSAENADDDTAGFTINPTSGLVTTEAGGTDTFDVVLDSEPTFDVSLPLSTSDPSEGLIHTGAGTPGSALSLTFTPGNWDTPQTVTLTGQDDLVRADGDIVYTIISSDPTSNDPVYDAFSGAAIDDVMATNLDDEPPQEVIVVPQVLVTDEDGAAVTFDVDLLTQPTADVTIPIGAGDPTEATVSPLSLTFTPANYDTPQTVTVTPVHDFIVDPDQTFDLVNGPASGGNYTGVAVPDVQVTINNVDVCTDVFFVDLEIGQPVVLQGFPTCVLDLYKTGGSPDPADWTFLGTFTIGPDGFVDTGIIAGPDCSYVATITQTFIVLNAGGLPAMTVPTLGQWGLIGMVSLLLLTGLYMVRRKRTA